MIESPERTLWRAVVERAILDALGHCTDEREISAQRVVRTRAQTWLTDNGADFRKVCDYAGLDPARVRQEAASILRDASKRRKFEERHVIDVMVEVPCAA